MRRCMLLSNALESAALVEATHVPHAWPSLEAFERLLAAQKRLENADNESRSLLAGADLGARMHAAEALRARLSKAVMHECAVMMAFGALRMSIMHSSKC